MRNNFELVLATKKQDEEKTVTKQKEALDKQIVEQKAAK